MEHYCRKKSDVSAILYDLKVHSGNLKHISSISHVLLIIIQSMTYVVINCKPIVNQCSPSYRNQSIDLRCKSIDWFLYDGKHWVVNGLMNDGEILNPIDLMWVSSSCSFSLLLRHKEQHANACSESCQTSKMEHLAKTYGFLVVNYFRKTLHLRCLEGF